MVTGLMTGCSFIGVYAVPSIEGTVVDAETGDPIEGAVVLVERSLRGGFEGFTGYYEYQETLTDVQGNYHVPALGLVFEPNRFDDYDPQLQIYKAGYRKGYLGNAWDCLDVKAESCIKNYYGRPPHDWYRESVWDGKTVGLMRFTGTTKERISALGDYKSVARHDHYRQQKCSWIGFEIPKYLRAINRELHSLNNLGLPYTMESMTVKAGTPGWVADQDRDCPKEWKRFFEEYNQ